jgi:hypothetical protein
MNQDVIHLDHFDGQNFIRWQQKMLFFLTTLKLAYNLEDDLEDITTNFFFFFCHLQLAT